MVEVVPKHTSTGCQPMDRNITPIAPVLVGKLASASVQVEKGGQVVWDCASVNPSVNLCSAKRNETLGPILCIAFAQILLFLDKTA